MAWLLVGCGADETSQCQKSEECPDGQRCVLSRCETPATADATDDTSTASCEGALVAAPGELRINEIHAAPANEDDVNCDNVPGSNDEFVEIVNTTDKLLSLDGVAFHYDGKLKEALAGCLPPGRGLVIYGGTIKAECTDFGETQAFVAEKTLSMSNSGKTVSLVGADAVSLDLVVYPSITGNSAWTRFPDFTGEFVFHAAVPGANARFSVGKCVSGAPLTLGCPLPDTGVIPTDCEGAIPAPPNALRINEVHAAPKAGVPEHDANCDGNPSSTQDEFIEVVNASTQKVSLAGIQLQVGGTTKHTFDTCLAPGRGLVVYSGGTASCTDLGETQAMVSGKALSLSNGGGAVSLADSAGAVLDNQAYASISDNTSRTRFPDFTGAALVKHSAADILGVETPHSAGKCVSGAPLTIDCALPGGVVTECGNGACEPGESAASCPEDCTGGLDCTDAVAPSADLIKINEVHPAPQAGNSDHDANCDGNPSSTQDEFIEIVNVSAQKVSLEGVTVLAQGDIKATLSTCLEPGRGLVVYSGGTAACANLGQTQAMVASSALGLTNSGGVIALHDAAAAVIDSYAYTNITGNTSRARFPDFTGTEFFKHSDTEIPGVTRPQSAGLCVSGAPLTIDCPPPSNATECGNSLCEAGEDPQTCPEDCSDTGCGNETCDNGETFETCPRDCPAPIFCEAGVSPNPGDVVINEVHFAPMSSEDDVNCDGLPSSDDEYIELVNTTGQVISLADVTLAYDGTNRHTFTAREGCLDPGQALVFYNRPLVPLCSPDQLGGSLAVVTRSAFSMTNTTSKVITIALDNVLLDTTSYVISGTSNGNASWTRSPDITGAFTKHSTAPNNIGRFSVGTCLNGGRFPDCEGSAGAVCGNAVCEATENPTSCPTDCATTGPVCPNAICEVGENNSTCPQDCPATGPVCGNAICETGEDSASCLQDCPVPACTDGSAPAAGEVVINEIHFAPLSSADDVNCDGLPSSSDEFVELVNTTGRKLNLDGVTVTYSGALKHTFTAAQACLNPGQGLVLYNGLAAATTTICAPGSSEVKGSLTVKSSASFPLSNTSPALLSLDLSGVNLDSQTYTTNTGNASWTRSPDITGAFTRHSTAPNSIGRFSLGSCLNGATFPDCAPVGPVCGNSVCETGETNASCAADCPPVGPVCGNSVCETGETNASCAADCPPAGPVCGNSMCETGETNASCPADCPPAACASGVTPSAGQLVINEIHFSPLSSTDDVNCDGVTSADDEYIELVNTSGQTLNLSGVTVTYAGTLRHTFTAAEACLAPGQAMIFYNALTAAVTTTCAPGATAVGGSLTVKSASRFAMSNTTGSPVSIDLGALNFDSQTYTTNTGSSSWTRSPDITGGFTRHSTVTGAVGRFSLGTCLNGNNFPNCQ